jgi:hypothetical protein
MNIQISMDTSQPPSGTVTAEGEVAQPFAGWLALIALISDLLGEPRR